MTFSVKKYCVDDIVAKRMWLVGVVSNLGCRITITIVIRSGHRHESDQANTTLDRLNPCPNVAFPL
jgi:hypothetical protein